MSVRKHKVWQLSKISKEGPGTIVKREKQRTQKNNCRYRRYNQSQSHQLDLCDSDQSEQKRNESHLATVV